MSTLKVLVYFCASLAMLPSHAYGAGTAAGVVIANETTISYQVSGVANTATASVTTRVAEIVDFTFVKNDTTTEKSVSSPASQIVEIFTLANTGNGPEEFAVQIDQAVADDFDVVNAQIYIEDGTTPNFQATEDVPYSAEIQLSADDSLVVYLVFDTPAGVADGEFARAGLTVITGTPGAAGQPVGTILPGAGETGVDAVLAVESGAISQSTDYRTSVADLAVVKSVAQIVDPFGDALPVPGAILTYQISITVTGSGQMDNVVISDPLPSELTYIPNSMVLNSIGITDQAGDDQGEFVTASNEVLVDLGSVPAGDSVTLEFKAEIK